MSLSRRTPRQGLSFGRQKYTLLRDWPRQLWRVSALIFRSESLRVGVVREGNKAELVPVILGKDYGNEVEVVSGIAENDSVIANPPDSLASGAAVQIVKSSDVR
jgi:hypothetical protein